MRNLVRGGFILVVLSLFVAIIYAQSRPEKVVELAKDSQPKTENSIAETNNTKPDPDTKLVKDTVSVRAAKATAASRGSFVATAYCLKGRTATGGGVRRGIIAADRRVLRLGSQVFLGAGSYSGQYTVTDTGGSIRGKHIDIWVPSCTEARRFGRRTVSISMLEP